MSLSGVYPLSPTLDAPGPLAVDVDSCYILDQLMCARAAPDADLPRLQPANLEALKFVVPDARVMTDLDETVKNAFERALAKLESAGADIVHAPMPVLDHCDDFFIERPVVIYEVWQYHREMLEHYGEEYDPFVGQRIVRFEVSPVDADLPLLIKKETRAVYCAEPELQ